MEQLTWTGERLVTSVNDQFFAIEHLHRYAMAVEISAGKIILDIACGEGYGTNLLAQKAAFVYGVDIDSNTILHANKKYAVPGKNIEFRQGSTSAIPLEAATVDVVVSFETIEHHDEHEQMMKEIKRVLKPGGILIISSPNRSVYKQLIPNNIFHVKELEFEELKKLLGKNFEHCHYFEQQFVAGSLITSLGKDGYRLKFFDGNYEGISNEIHSVNYFNKPY
ncbi:MAG: class I SAM-dependent methyltransferase, partial [Chitinophagaceae bacterium]